jgi:hypothetical protein
LIDLNGYYDEEGNYVHTYVKSLEFPPGDLANDDDDENRDNDVIPLNGHIYSIDAPGVPIQTINNLLTLDDEFIKRSQFHEFVRVRFDGERPSGDTLSGSRCSHKWRWHSFVWLELDRNGSPRSPTWLNMEDHNKSDVWYDPPNLEPAPTP